jgi:hypothetical protein
MSDEKIDNLHENVEGQNETPSAEEVKKEISQKSASEKQDSDLKEENKESEQVVEASSEDVKAEQEEVTQELNEAETTEETETKTVAEDEDSDDSDDSDVNHEYVEIPVENYSNFSEDQLIESAENLLNSYSVQSIIKHIEQIREVFYQKIKIEEKQKLEEFLAEGGNEIDFRFESYAKGRFGKIYTEFRHKKDKYFKNLENAFEANYDKRLALIEELKHLINKEEKMSDTYKEFKEIQEKWRNAGQVAKTKSNDLWRNYHHHVENFYDYLRLNNEMRDLDFKHNLEEKMKIVERAEELAESDNIKAAFDELQDLHRIWKEETGPVAKEFRDEIWNRFSDSTKKIHDKRNEHLKELKDVWQKNYELKAEVCKKIEEVASRENQSHGQWQNNIKEIDRLKDEFQKIGRVPKRLNNDIWDLFKEATRKFNRKKNEFYKGLKKDQIINLEKKNKLVELAESLKDSDDWKATTDVLKKIQADWKKIGHVPKQHSDEVWNKFRAACNHFFDRLSDHNKGKESKLYANLEAKKAMLEDLKVIELKEDNKKAINQLKEVISMWKACGKIPRSENGIEKEFNKLLDSYFEKLDLDKAESEMIRFRNKIDGFVQDDDMKKVYHERDVIRRKMDEIRKEISQLDNNLGFFNVDENSPLVKDVMKKMAAHKENLKAWKSKLDYLRTI